MQTIDFAELLGRGIANIIPSKEELERLLNSGKILNIYLGIDPTATRIHLGHAVPLRKLQQFVKLKHNVTFLIGDFTALIGDTSDKDSERPMLTTEQIHENFQTYKKQAGKIIDFSQPNVKVVHNSDWLQKLSFEDIIKLCQHFSFGDFASRELIAKRLKDKKHVGLHEALYPVMQGYDSYYMDTDIQVGGTDQTFNMQAGRILQKNLRNKQSYILATEFLIGTDNKKMSKTGGNAIWLDEKPREMYGKIMSIDDEALDNYFRLGTKIPLDKINHIIQVRLKNENPRDIKKELAFALVEELHSKEAAQDAQEYFEKTVQKKDIPTEIPQYKISKENNLYFITDLLVQTGLATSKSEAKRLVEQGGVEVDNERIQDANKEIIIKDNVVIKVGKRKFLEIIYE